VLTWSQAMRVHDKKVARLGKIGYLLFIVEIVLKERR